MTAISDLDAVELGELLEFLGSFFAAEQAVMALALDRVCAGGYSVAELRADLARFAFLLGSDGSYAMLFALGAVPFVLALALEAMTGRYTCRLTMR
jgi:hypothetical protein